MFEHMMFKGTARVRPDGQTMALNALGGYGNAATDEDATHYSDTVPVAYLDYAVQLEAERMRNLLFRKPMIDVEREVVKDEIRQQEQSPLAQGLLRCLAVEFLRHPYAWTAAGTVKDLDQTTPEDLKKFYDTYYQPNNAMVVVVGKVATADVKASVEKWFGQIPKAGDPPRPAAAVQEPEQTARRRSVVEPGVFGLTMIGWHLPPGKSKDLYALQIASLVLGGGDASRLKVRLKSSDARTGQPLAVDAGTEMVIHEDPGVAIALGAYIDPSQGDAIEAAIFDEVGKLAAKGPSPDELRRARTQLQTGYTFSLESSQGLAEAIGRAWILTGDPAGFARDVDALENVSVADVQRVARQYLTTDHATIVVIPPKAR
jgi:zinc protease